MGRNEVTNQTSEAARPPRCAAVTGYRVTHPIARRETLKPGRHPPRVFRAAAVFLLAGMLAAATAQAGLYRVTCKGIFKLSTNATGDSCAESGKLDDADGRFLPSFSEALADVGQGVLAATASGGAIRGVGYGGREATSVIIEQFRLRRLVDGNDARRDHHEAPLPVRGRRRIAARGAAQKLRLQNGPGSSTRSRCGCTSPDSAARWCSPATRRVASSNRPTAASRIARPSSSRLSSGSTRRLPKSRYAPISWPTRCRTWDGSRNRSRRWWTPEATIEFAAPCPFRIEAPSHMIGWSARVADDGARETRAFGADGSRPTLLAVRLVLTRSVSCRLAQLRRPVVPDVLNVDDDVRYHRLRNMKTISITMDEPLLQVSGRGREGGPQDSLGPVVAWRCRNGSPRRGGTSLAAEDRAGYETQPVGPDEFDVLIAAQGAGVWDTGEGSGG